MQFQIIRDTIRNGILPSDEQFDSLFPEGIRSYANQHFSGVYAIKQAAQFLCDQKDPKILDIGSGAGKFCLLAALLHNGAEFVGVEYRSELVSVSKDLADNFALNNIHFFCENVLNVDFTPFNGFFMFNPFLEHRKSNARLEGFFDYNHDDFYYQEHLNIKLSSMHTRAKLVTYHVNRSLVPKSFKCVFEKMGGALLFWEK